MNKTNVERVFVAGHRGMVGAAIVRRLKSMTTGTSLQLVLRSHDELDLSDSAQVEAFFSSHAIDTVYMAAARVGGIQANNLQPAEFIQQNL